MIAIDFTGSNGNPSKPNSLHYLNTSGQYNQYQSALYEVSEILLYYDYDKNIPMFGFGAKVNNNNEANHCFPMTFNPQNYCVQGLQGIMQAYSYSLSNVKLSGPTYFGEILQQTKQLSIQQKDQNVYTILLILTDGEIHDMDKTLEILISCSSVPLSVIIVGVGNEDFEKMQILDGDDGLRSTGKQYRDLVQFVKFNQYQGNPAGLAEEVLKELPTQLVEYMLSMGLQPQPPKQINFENITQAN
eukprot:TRINITY_DN3990_c0_g1_i2.p1 TRINITY_DN3990_c0_g1~~TRINITY_DN3990_c0_g1_i2.p1  ORF type:complete len:244 (-),score=35.50 TRINITY_DN3990_c0_g1_i2:74-805(-)